MFQFPGLADVTYVFSHAWAVVPPRVFPFGNPRIKARSQLPEAYRSYPRPSSPLIA